MTWIPKLKDKEYTVVFYKGENCGIEPWEGCWEVRSNLHLLTSYMPYWSKNLGTVSDLDIEIHSSGDKIDIDMYPFYGNKENPGDERYFEIIDYKNYYIALVRDDEGFLSSKIFRLMDTKDDKGIKEIGKELLEYIKANYRYVEFEV